MKFRKKPVVIDAIEWDQTPQTLQKLNDLGAALKIVGMDTSASGKIISNLRLETLEGILHVSDGDWIIRGVKGEFYPCKPDIFTMTYEAVTNEI